MRKKLKQNELCRSMKKLLTAIVLVLMVGLLGATVNAQNVTVTGSLKNTSGEPVPGTTVVVKGTTQGTVTDSDGNYSLSNVQDDAILVFSFVGLKTQEIPVNGRTEISVIMVEEAIGLDEVVAIGYGTVKKRDITGGISTLSGNTVSDRKTVRLSQSLQGNVPGLMVTRGGNAPDQSASIKIRGITTISDSNPLIIIDGIPGTLDYVDPDDVEEITVLKDAASASIYGSRAAAGVILVTTKRAKTGQLSLDYSYEYGIDIPTAVAKNAGAVDYMKVSNERSWNDAGNTGTQYPIYSEDVINNYAALNAENPDRYPDWDWTNLILNDYAPHQSHNLVLTGGSETIRSKVSLNYDQTGALYDGRDYDRMILRANNDFKFNDYLSATIDIHGIYSVDNSPSLDFSPNNIGAAPIYAPMWSDGRVGEGKSGWNFFGRLKYGGFNKTTAQAISGKASIVFTPIEGLKISAILSPTRYNSKNKYMVKQVPYTSWDEPDNIIGYLDGTNTTKLTENRNDNHSVTTQFLGDYNKTLGEHTFTVLAGFENYYSFNESLGAIRDQYLLTNYPYLDLGNENYQFNYGRASEYAYRSFFGRILYNYKYKYYIQVNTRYDGSSRFHKDYRWGIFPSFSAGWAISEESFMQNVGWLSFLKLRGSWGSLGNERIGSQYPYQSTIGFNNVLVYAGSSPSVAQSAIVNKYAIPDISWESTESYNLGLDANFFDSKLMWNIDVYKKTTKDMLLNLEIPNYIGLSNPDQNAGNMYTTGWELQVGWNDKIGDLSYSASFNLSDFRSKMGNLDGTEFLGNQAKFEGSEFNEWYGYVSEGLYQSEEEVEGSAVLNAKVGPGDIRYKDVSGPDGVPDGKISPDFDRVLLGGSLPRFLYGGNVNLGYKNFDLNLGFQGVGKQITQLGQRMVRPFIIEWIEVPQIIVGNYWSKNNTDEENLKARYPKISQGADANNYAFSDFWLFDGYYFRVKNISLGYSIPDRVVEKFKIQNLRIFGTVTDLPSINNWPKGWDPEGSSYWISTSYILGISVKF
jgi:TonB-linked SusC/RagA family outer membrane protein